MHVDGNSVSSCYRREILGLMSGNLAGWMYGPLFSKAGRFICSGLKCQLRSGD